MNQELARIDELKQMIAETNNLSDARKMLVLSEGILTTATKLYKASTKIFEVKEDRDSAYQTALRAAEIRLMAEARLGELLKETEFQKNQYAGNSEVTTKLKDIGLSKMDSHRYQRVAEFQDYIPVAVEEAGGVA